MNKTMATAQMALCFLLALHTGSSAGAAPPKLLGQWVLGSGFILGKPEKIELFKNGAGLVDDRMDISWEVRKKRLVMSSPLIDLSCAYKLSGNELTLVYDGENSATFVRNGKMGEFRAKPYAVQAKRQKPQIGRLMSQHFVSVAGGTFLMGCTVEQDSADCDKDERPVRSVTVGNFQIGKYEVTQQLWELVMGSNPSGFKGDDLPVESVSWDEAQVFISTLNLVTGKKYRLPTEAEWEYAARGGNKSKGYRYAGSNNIEDVAWYGRNSGSKTRPVGAKQANELGIHDMSGNVWEWVEDWYGRYGPDAQTNPTGPNNGTSRVIRGGSWHYNAMLCRVSNRDIITPDYRFTNLGLRLVISQ